MTKITGARVLVVEDDLDQHKVILDILGITLKDAKVERAMNAASFLSKVRRPKTTYNLILFDLNFHAPSGTGVLSAIRAEMPLLEKSLVVMVNSMDEYRAADAAKGLPCILKPFSLDSFSEIVKQVCGR
jgi:DNA-binding NtrC family response regulator